MANLLENLFNDHDSEENDEEEDHFKISEYFRLKNVLGKGMFGKVYSAYCYGIKKDVALKIIKKRNFSADKLKVLRYEESIISQLDHENVISFYMTKETSKLIIMAMELAKGDNLNELFMKGIAFDNDLIRNIMRELLSAVRYIHSKKIVHRDIKPENIMIQLKENKLEGLKLVDFGLSFQMLGSYLIVEAVGTPLYLATEIILKKPYGQLIDIWSSGIVFYMLFSQGKHPIYVPKTSPEEFYEKVLNFDCSFPENMDKKAIDLFQKMCLPNPEERLDANQALNHPWMTGKEEIIFNPMEKLRIFNNLENTIEYIKTIIFIEYLIKTQASLDKNKKKQHPNLVLKKFVDVQEKKQPNSLSASKTNKIILPSLSSCTKNLKSNFNFDMTFSQKLDTDEYESPEISPSFKGNFKIIRKSESKASLGKCSMKKSVLQTSFAVSLNKNYSSTASLLLDSDSKNSQNNDETQQRKFSSYNKIKIGDDLLNSTRSCLNSNLKKDISDVKSGFLPSINKNLVPVLNKMKSNSCFTKNDDKLPIIHKASKFKSDKR